MSRLPSDIWIHIAEFLPDDGLQSVFAVNSTLHHLALNARYRELTVNDLANPRLARKLRRLRDPYVANRVRALTIHLEKNHHVTADWYTYSQDGRRFSPFVGRFTRKATSTAPQTAAEKARLIIKILTNLVLRLPNVITLRVIALNVLLSTQSQPIFDAAWRTFGHSLRSIALEGWVHHLPTSLSPPDGARVRELHLTFHDIDWPSLVDEKDQFCNAIVNAFCKLGPSLEDLRLSFLLHPWNEGDPDISYIFDHIPVLPHLKTLAVTTSHLWVNHLSPLKQLLYNHAGTLRRVNLNLGGPGSGRRPGTFYEHHLLSLMTDLLSNNKLFVDLESFEFMPVTASSFTVITMYITRCENTLTSLTLVDRYLSYEDLVTLTGIFPRITASSHLRSLILNVEFFGPQLLALLATVFPGLKHLDLRAFDWGAEDTRMTFPSLFQRLDSLKACMAKRRQLFLRWGVQDVVVVLGERCHPPDWPRFISKCVVSILCECFPTAQCSWGVDETGSHRI